MRRLSEGIAMVSKTIETKHYSTRQAADLLAVSEKTVRRLIQAGELAATRVRRSVRISEAALRTFIARNQM